MPSRTHTLDQTVISLPDGRTYDFTNTPRTPHNIRITASGLYTFDTLQMGWHEEHSEELTCVKGRVHTYKAHAINSSVDSSFGVGSIEKLERWALYYWNRDRYWKPQQLPTEETALLGRGKDEDRETVNLEAHHTRDGDATSHRSHSTLEDATSREDKLEVAIDLSIAPDHWDQQYGRRYELFHRNYASMHLDASMYPSLPSTPLPIRLLFKLPSFLFPALLRNWVIAYFLSIQILVLSSAFDYHPYMGRLPIAAVYMLLVKGIQIWPEPIPEWVAKWEWNTMIVISHIKVAFWRMIGKRLLGMSETYEEYSPERLKDSLGPTTETLKFADV